MARRRLSRQVNQPSLISVHYTWPALIAKDGEELFDHYRHTLEALGNEKGAHAG